MLIRSFLFFGVLAGAVTCAEPSQIARAPESSPVERINLIVSPIPQMHDVRRIGMNLGTWTSWGAEQLGSNIIKNPGFEGVVEGALATVKSSNGTTLVLDGWGVSRPDGFWNGASIDLRTGVSAGKRAKVNAFYGSGKNSNARRALLDSQVVAAPGDVVALTRIDDASAPTQWWLSENQRHCGSGPPRPGSAGVRSLVLCSTAADPAEASSFLDATTARSGKMLPIRGKWRFSVWSRTLQGGADLKVSFRRSHSRPFFVREFKPARSWKQTVIEFDATDDGPDGPLQLQLSACGEGRIAVDDVFLSSVADGDFPFRHEVTAALQTLKPGYLRDWQGQLGDSIRNRLASPSARRASRYRSDRAEDAKYEYSIPEFLQLCHRVGSNPWLVLPTTVSDKEYVALGSYLARAQALMHFDEILIEFGNENWNPLFSAAGIQDATHHSCAAARAFRYVREGSGSTVPLRTVINAQFANPSEVAELLRQRSSNMVAVAPYFAYELPAAATPGTRDLALFSDAGETFAQLEASAVQNHEELAVYEVNLHTTGGTATGAERDQFVLSPESGSALAMRLLQALLSGVRRQCVYSLAGFDAYTSDHSEFVQLWGVVRDLAGEPVLRSTGMAVLMLNESVQEEAHEITLQGKNQLGNLTAIAFRGNRGWSAAIVSGRSQPLQARLSFPVTQGEVLPAETLTLTDERDKAAGGPQLDRGHAATVNGRTTVEFQVPPRSLVVLLPPQLQQEPNVGVAQ